MNKELIRKIIDKAWMIKTKYPKKYKPYNNFNIPISIISNYIVYTYEDQEITATVYYSYYLVLGVF